MHTTERYSAVKKDEILSPATTGTELKGMTLSDVGRSERDRCQMISLLRESEPASEGK